MPANAQIAPAGRVHTASPIPSRLNLTITGDPATPDFITTSVRNAIVDALGAAGESATPNITLLPQPQPLGSGFLTSYTAAVADAGTASTAGTVTVDVVNAALPPFTPARLAFTDDPERIIGDGVLSRTTIDAEHPARVYYYHENTRTRRRFCVILSANGSVRTTVQIVGAEAGPNVDVMSVGHAASKTFLSRKPRNEGLVTEIAGGRPMVQRDVVVEPGEVVAGALDLRVFFGGPVTVTALAIPLDAEPSTWLYAPQLATDGHGRHGEFDLTDFGRQIIAYTVGAPDAAYRYGSRQRTPPNAARADPGRDYGDYGVLQRVTFDLDNPSADPVSVYLYERPLGGAVRSSFAVNGAIIDVGCVRVPQRYAVSRYDLAPHATGVLDVLTMTDGGSNYPLEIGVTATPPRAQTPPLAAPDGCFPKPRRGPQPPAGTPGR